MEENIFNAEIGRKFLALVKAGLKVSDLIPDLIFREKIKAQILNVYKFFITKQHSDLLKEIDILDGFFFLAGQMNFIKDSHLRVLRNGILIFKSRIILLDNNTNDTNKNTRMTRIESDVSEYKEKPASAKSEKLSERSVYTDRQKKILEKFQDRETLKLSEIVGFFPDVSEKTVRNDLKLLIGLKKIIRNGNGSGSFYQIMRK